MLINLTKILRVPFCTVTAVTIEFDEFLATLVLIETFSLVSKEKSFLRYTIFGNYVLDV